MQKRLNSQKPDFEVMVFKVNKLWQDSIDLYCTVTVGELSEIAPKVPILAVEQGFQKTSSLRSQRSRSQIGCHKKLFIAQSEKSRQSLPYSKGEPKIQGFWVKMLSVLVLETRMGLKSFLLHVESNLFYHQRRITHFFMFCGLTPFCIIPSI